jgi:hypothetical protein
VVSVLAGVLALVMGQAAAAADERYMLRAAHSGKCLDVLGGPAATASGVAVQQWGCLNADQTNQHWYFTPAGDGATFFVKAGHSGKCLDVTGGVDATADGVPVQQWACVSFAQSNQRWSVVPAGDSTTYFLKAAHSGKCLDVRGGQGALDDGVPLQQYTCRDYTQSNQRFFFTDLGGIPVVPDLDGDGANLQADCNDALVDIHPGAPDPASDGIDQNCDGADSAPAQQAPATAEGPARLLLVRVVNLWRLQGRRTLVRELEVRGAPRGTRVALECRGRGCPSRRKARIVRKGAVDLQGQFKRRRLSAGTVIRLRVDMPGLERYEVRFRMRAGKLPQRTDLCPVEGSSRLGPCS